MHARGEWRGADARDAVRWLGAAQQGSAPAQYNLALLYLRGTGVERDEAEAARWMRSAADQGLVVAQEKLSRMEESEQLARREP